MRSILPFASRLLPLLTVLCTASVACTIQASDADDDASGGSSSGGESSSGGGSSSPAEDCEDRCEALADRCGQPSGPCSDACGRITEAQLACAERAGCDEDAFSDCQRSSSSSSGGGSSSGGTSSGGTSSGGSSSSGGSTKPSALTVTGSFGSVKAIHVKSGDTIASNISIGPKPTVSPAASELPTLSKGTVRVVSPSPGSCTSKPSLTLNPSQIGVSVTGTDALPAIDCAKFTDAIASQGIELVVEDAPYPNGGSATVTIRLRP